MCFQPVMLFVGLFADTELNCRLLPPPDGIVIVRDRSFVTLVVAISQ